MITATIVDDEPYCCVSCRLLLLIFCFVIPGSLLAQPLPLKFEYLTTIDGLSHNNVSCILQDKQGYMWFGTEYGLNRYDGYAFNMFKNIQKFTFVIDFQWYIN